MWYYCCLYDFIVVLVIYEDMYMIILVENFSMSRGVVFGEFVVIDGFWEIKNYFFLDV